MRPIDPGKAYRQVSTQTASAGQLVLMLYDGAIRFLERALLGFDREDPAEFHETIHNNVQRAQAIITELDLSLNLNEGGELGATLHRLYEYLNGRLHESNLHKTEDGIREAIQRLSVLRDAWSKMLQGPALVGPRTSARIARTTA